MSILTIAPRRKPLVNLPHYLLINDQLLGIMKSDPVQVQVPDGSYKITIRSTYKFIEGTADITIIDN